MHSFLFSKYLFFISFKIKKFQEAKEARLIREHESEEAAKEGRKPDPPEVSKEMSKFKTQMRNYRESARSGKEDFEEVS